MAGEWANDQPETLTVGLPNAGHVVLDPDGLHLYGNDGVTLVLDFQNSTGTLALFGSASSSAANGDNLIRNGAMTDTHVDAQTGLTAPLGWGYNTTDTRTQLSAGHPGYLHAEIQNVAQLNDVFNTYRVNVNPGDLVYGECLAFAAIGGFMQAGLVFYWYDAADVSVTETDAALTLINATNAGTAQRLTLTATVPANVAYFRLGLRFQSPATSPLTINAGLFYAYKRRPIDAISSGAINGLFTIGDPAAAHVAIGSDAHGADGVRLYAADGVTPLIDLNITGGVPLLSLQTAGTGQRVELSTDANIERAKFFTGDPAETLYGYVGSLVGGAGGTRNGELVVQSPNLGHGAAEMVAVSGSADGTIQPYLQMVDPLINSHWHPLAFANGWHNYGSDSGGLYAVAAWRINADGSADLKGLIAGGTQVDGTVIGDGPSVGSIYARNIPTTENHVFPAIALNSSGGFALVRIDFKGTGSGTPGKLVITGMGGMGAGSLVSLSGIHIPVQPLAL